MVCVTFVFKLLLFLILEHFCLGYLNVTRLTQPFQNVVNQTTRVIPRNLNVTNLANFTYTLPARAVNLTELAYNSTLGSNSTQEQQVDCLGLGKTVASSLENFFRSEPNGSNALDVRFFMSSSIERRRVHVEIGEQFGLEWTDFVMERRTVFIVHGFLSHGEENWIKDMEKAFHEWVRHYAC